MDADEFATDETEALLREMSALCEPSTEHIDATKGPALLVVLQHEAEPRFLTTHGLDAVLATLSPEVQRAVIDLWRALFGDGDE